MASGYMGATKPLHWGRQDKLCLRGRSATSFASDRHRTRAISIYLADNRDHFLQKLFPKFRCAHRRRCDLLRLARRAFRTESADVHRLYFRKAVRRRLRGKQAAPAFGLGPNLPTSTSGGIQASGGVEKPAIVEASGGVEAPTTPPIRCRCSSPGSVQKRCEEVPSPSLNSDLHVPDAHTRDEAQAVGGGQHDPRTSPAPSRAQTLACGDVRALPTTTAHECTQTIAPDQQMLACGDVRALTAGRLRTPWWGQHFEIRGSGPQAKVHSCIVSHIVDLRALYGDIAAADVLGASLRCLHLFESALGLTDSRGTGSSSQVRDDKVASQVKAAAILGLAIKMVLSDDCTAKVPMATLWGTVAGNANVALVQTLEIQLVNQWPGPEY